MALVVLIGLMKGMEQNGSITQEGQYCSIYPEKSVEIVSHIRTPNQPIPTHLYLLMCVI